MADIRFGTDGWRAVIAGDFTFDNVRAVAQATADWMRRRGLHERGAVVGYDTRFLSDAFANAAAEVLAGNDIHVGLASSAAPTPALSHAVLQRDAGAGIVITASHNPARWNGFKIKQAVGNSAPPEVTAEIEQSVPGIITGDRVQIVAQGDAVARGLIERFDPRPTYVTALRDFVDVGAIHAAGLNVAVDSMYGAAGGLTAEVLGEGATAVHELHGERNPAFPGDARAGTDRGEPRAAAQARAGRRLRHRPRHRRRRRPPRPRRRGRHVPQPAPGVRADRALPAGGAWGARRHRALHYHDEDGRPAGPPLRLPRLRDPRRPSSSSAPR